MVNFEEIEKHIRVSFDGIQRINRDNERETECVGTIKFAAARYFPDGTPENIVYKQLCKDISRHIFGKYDAVVSAAKELCLIGYGHDDLAPLAKALKALEQT